VEWVFCESCGHQLHPRIISHTKKIEKSGEAKSIHTNVESTIRRKKKISKQQRSIHSAEPSISERSIHEKHQRHVERMVRFLENHNKSISEAYIRKIGDNTPPLKKSYISVLKDAKRLDSYLDEMPSIIDCIKEEASRSPVNGTHTSDSEEILYWGAQSSADEENDMNAKLRKMHLFNGSYWGAQTAEDAESESKDDYQTEPERELPVVVEADEEAVGDESLETDELEQDHDAGDNAQSTNLSDERPHLNSSDDHFSSEVGRRQINSEYRRSIHMMKQAIKNTLIEVDRDPLLQSCPVHIYRRLRERLQCVESEANSSFVRISALYELCHIDAEKRRHRAAWEVAEAQRRAIEVRDEHDKKYANVTAGLPVNVHSSTHDTKHHPISDPYLIKMNQQAVREAADKELAIHREIVNSCIAAETEEILAIKSEENILQTSIGMYHPQFDTLKQEIQVVYDRVVSMLRWVSARVIQKKFRSHRQYRSSLR